jgi:hypothetical protein
MYVVINRYAGAASRTDAALPKVRAEFVPLLQGCDGFLGYATFPTEEGDVIACLFWEHGEAAASSRDKIGGWVRDHLEGFEEPTDRGPEQPFFCLVRTSAGIPTDGSQRLNAEAMRDAAKAMPGFRGMYFARSDADPVRGAAVLFCDTEEQAIAVDEATRAISARNQPKVELSIMAAGQTAILAMS